MPVYEYCCLDCGVVFEKIVLKGTEVACSACRSERLERLPSLFSVDSNGTRAANRADGVRRSAKERKDKAVADHDMIRNHHH